MCLLLSKLINSQKKWDPTSTISSPSILWAIHYNYVARAFNMPTLSKQLYLCYMNSEQSNYTLTATLL